MIETKDDWEQAQQRLLAWWRCEAVDRACIQVTAPRDGVRPRPIADPGSVAARWANLAYVLESQAERIRCTYYGGEAFPLFHANLGPDIFAGFLGAPIHFAPDTSWADPIIAGWETRPALTLDSGNRWWRLMIDLLTAAADAGRGKWITGIPDTHAGGDALAALRGRQELCFDLIDHPGAVQAAMADLTALVDPVYSKFFACVDWQTDGSSSGWLPTWSTGRCNVIQCDLLALISPAMAERFFLDELVVQARWLDQVIYHLDGPQCICHLDWLLAIPEIHAIQWVPGAGQPPMRAWVPLLKRIQAAGRALHLTVTPADIEPLLAELSPAGLMLHTQVDSEAEAKELIRRVAAWSCRR